MLRVLKSVNFIIISFKCIKGLLSYLVFKTALSFEGVYLLNIVSTFFCCQKLNF
jgi:hypothetical protein